MIGKIIGIIILVIFVMVFLFLLALGITALYIIAENDNDNTDDSDVVYAPRGNQHGLGSTSTRTDSKVNRTTQK